MDSGSTAATDNSSPESNPLGGRSANQRWIPKWQRTIVENPWAAACDDIVTPQIVAGELKSYQLATGCGPNILPLCVHHYDSVHRPTVKDSNRNIIASNRVEHARTSELPVCWYRSHAYPEDKPTVWDISNYFSISTNDLSNKHSPPTVACSPDFDLGGA